MRLLHVLTRELHEFSSDPPPYAILSHTWGKEEVTFEDVGKPNHSSKLGFKMGKPNYTSMRGYKKIDGCCKQAQLSGFEWVWIDTCCIDKSSSAELTETINSMFAWYERSSMCYIYLEDVPPADPDDHKAQGSAFRSSRWFTRGWTLQELLASRHRQIFDSMWQRIYLDSDGGPNHPGRASEMEDRLLSEITGIPKQCLQRITPLSNYSVSERMSWACRRSTTRVEDMAYCLLGIFEVNMPLLYGEGGRAFFRLQEEIIRKTPDETILCWDHGHCQGENSKGKPTAALALSPAEFTHGGELYERSAVADSKRFVIKRYEAAERLASHTTLSNQGILIELPLQFIDELNGLALAILNVETGPVDRRRVALPVVRANRLYSNIFTKAPGSTVFVLPKDYSPPPSSARIYLQHWSNKEWKISSTSIHDYPLSCNLELRGDSWRVDGWRCNGWYPPIPLAVNSINPTKRSYASVYSSLPPRILVIFGNQTSSLLCDLVTTRNKQSFEVKIGLSIVMTPALTPLKVLYSAGSQNVQLSKLDRFKWSNPAVHSTLACGGRVVHGMAKYRPKAGYSAFDLNQGLVNVELSMT
jgi:hypothetical protein